MNKITFAGFRRLIKVLSGAVLIGGPLMGEGSDHLLNDCFGITPANCPGGLAQPRGGAVMQTKPDDKGYWLSKASIATLTIGNGQLATITIKCECMPVGNGTLRISLLKYENGVQDLQWGWAGPSPSVLGSSEHSLHDIRIGFGGEVVITVQGGQGTKYHGTAKSDTGLTRACVCNIGSRSVRFNALDGNVKFALFTSGASADETTGFSIDCQVEKNGSYLPDEDPGDYLRNGKYGQPNAKNPNEVDLTFITTEPGAKITYGTVNHNSTEALVRILKGQRFGDKLPGVSLPTQSGSKREGTLTFMGWKTIRNEYITEDSCAPQDDTTYYAEIKKILSCDSSEMVQVPSKVDGGAPSYVYVGGAMKISSESKGGSLLGTLMQHAVGEVTITTTGGAYLDLSDSDYEWTVKENSWGTSAGETVTKDLVLLPGETTLVRKSKESNGTTQAVSFDSNGGIFDFAQKQTSTWFSSVVDQQESVSQTFYPGVIQQTVTGSTKETFDTVMPQDPVSPGKSFKGWFTQPEGGTEVKSTDQISSAVTKLYAQFMPSESVTVSLDAGDVELSASTAFIDLINSAKSEDVMLPFKPGYEFQGYSTSKTGATGYVIDNTGKTTDSSLSLLKDLLAKTDANTTTWNAQIAGIDSAAGKTSSGSTSSSAAALYAVFKPTTVTSQSGGNSVAASSGKRITLDGQGGSGGSSSVTATSGSVLPSVRIPIKLGYSFMGYYSGKSGQGVQYIDKNGKGLLSSRWVSASGHTTLYAYWQTLGNTQLKSVANLRGSAAESSPAEAKTCRVSFDPMGGICSVMEQTLVCGGQYGAAVLPTPVWTGRTFAGWWTDNILGERVTSSSVVPTTSEVTLFARWESTNCQIVLDANGGVSDTVSLTLISGANFVGLPVPVRYGCTFDGWYTAATGGDLVDESVTVTGPATLYAHWSVRVTFVDGGGEGTVLARSYVPGTSFGTLPEAPKGNGTFIGWFRNEHMKVLADDIVPEGDMVASARWIGEAEVNEMNWSFDVFGTNRWSITGLVDARCAVGCHPESVEIPSNIIGRTVTSLDWLGWGEGNLQTKVIAIPECVRQIPRHFFGSWYRLESMVYPAGLTSDIADRPVLSECSSLRQVVFPQGVEVITEEALLNCTSLTHVVVGKDVRIVGRDAFAGCPPNMVVRFWGAPPSGLVTAGIRPEVSVLYPKSQSSTWIGELTKCGLKAAVAFDDSSSTIALVEFDACGGTLGMSSQSYAVGSSYAVLPRPVKTGYDFVCWRTGKTSGSSVTASSIVQKTVTKLYADWKKSDALPTISGVSATSDRTDGIKLEWDAPVGLGSYSVYRSQSFETSQPKPIAIVSGTEYLDASVERGIEYRYWIVGSNGKGTAHSATVVGRMVASVAVWPTNFVFEATGGTGTIEINGVGSWTAKCMTLDVSLSRHSSNGSGELTFTVDAATVASTATSTVEIVSYGSGGCKIVPVTIVRKGASAADLSASLGMKVGWQSAAFLTGDVLTAPASTFKEGEPISLSMGIVKAEIATAASKVCVCHELRNKITGALVATVRETLDMPSLGTVGGYDQYRLPILQMLETGMYELKSSIEALDGSSVSLPGKTTSTITFTVEEASDLKICHDAEGRAWQLLQGADGKSFSVFSVWPSPTGSLEIPESIAGLQISSIEDYAFAGCQLTNVVIGASVTNVGAWAFGNIDGLKSVTFKNPETRFDIHAFEIQEDFAALSGAKFTLNSLKLEDDDAALGWLTSNGGLRTLDLSTFETPVCETGETLSLRLVRNGDADIVGGTLSLDKSTVQVSAEGGTFAVKVTATAGMFWWTAVSASVAPLQIHARNASWISLGTEAGMGGGMISFTVDRNAFAGFRTGKITVLGTGTSKVLTIVQEGSEVPNNDAFANAQSLAGLAGSVSGTTGAATLEEGERGLACGRAVRAIIKESVTNTVWYSWMATNDGLVEFSLKSYGKQEVKVFEGTSLKSLETVATRRLGDDETEGTLRFSAHAGMTYYIRVGDLMDVLAVGVVRGSAFTLSWNGQAEPKRLYVSQANGNDENSGATAETSMKTIAAAIAAAEDLMEIVVADGEYPPVSMTGEFPQQDEPRLILIGGDSQSKKVTIRSLNGPDRTVIDGKGVGPCLFGDNRCTIVGFTLRNGSGENYGGAKNAVLENCRIIGNRTTQVCYSEFDYTQSGSAAGAVSSTLRNCILAGNVAAGGASAVDGCRLEGCTVYSNMVTSVSGSCSSGISRSTCVNSIVWGNCHTGYAEPTVDNYTSWSVLSNCCTSPLPSSGAGNIAADPLLDVVDFGLLDGSPCIDAGDDRLTVSATDAYGSRRTVGTAVDIGAVEFAPVVVTLYPNGGAGDPQSWLCQRNRDRNLPGAVFSQNGYFMVGWSESSNGSTGVMSLGARKRYSEEKTLFAVWQKGDLIVSPQAFAFDADGGESVISVSADVPWTLSTDADWLSFGRKTGRGTADVSVSADFNAQSADRTAKVVVEAGGVRKTVTVSLAGYSGAGELVVRDGVLLGCRGDLPSRVVVPDAVTNVADRAFAGRQDVELVRIPASVRHLGSAVFADSSVKRVWYAGEEPTCPSDLYLGSCDNLVSYAETNGWHCGFSMSMSGEYVIDKYGLKTWIMKTVCYWPVGAVSRELVKGARNVNSPVTVNFRLTEDPADILTVVMTPGTKYQLPNIGDREGYYFVKWESVDDDREISSDTIVLGDKDVENYYAVWRGIPYAIHYDGNGGAGTMTDVSARYGNEETCAQNAFTRKGCVFVGWSSEPTGVAELQPGEAVVDLATRFGDVATLYAVWKPASADCYLVEQKLPNVAESLSIQECKPGRVYKLPPCTATPPSGKRFAGWACSNGRRYDDGMLVFNLAEPGKTVTMTAIWE